MDYGFSPTRGGTLHLSPTHHRTSFDNALGALRRSMSRSPSKRSASPRPAFSTPRQALLSPPLASPLHNSMSATDEQSENTSPSIHLKKARSLRRNTPVRFPQYNRSASRTTPRRGLSDLSDNGNGTGNMQTFFDPDDAMEAVSTTPKTGPPSSWFPVAQQQQQPPCAWHAPAGPAMGLFTTADTESAHKSSPLKRSDGLMNLEQPCLGSPSTKRRSLNGGTFEPSRETLVHQPLAGDNADSSDDDMHQTLRSSVSQGRLNTPRRAILRSQSSRNRRSVELGAETPVFSRTSKSKRSSLDSAVPTKLFQNAPKTADQDLGTSFAARSNAGRSARPPRHPLANALTPTSPSPERDDFLEPTGAALQAQAQVSHPFAKSLPLGALRPGANKVASLFPKPSVPTSFESKPFDTPDAFQLSRPNPAAFKSTGLISKKHKDIDAMPPPAAKIMPDTPIKKAHTNFGFTPSPAPALQMPISKPRFHQPDFGTPCQATVAPYGSFLGSLSRRASNISSDGEEGRGDSMSSADEFPPTPTKHGSSNSRQISLRSSILGRRPSVQQATFVDPAAQDSDSTNEPEPKDPFRKTIRHGDHKSPPTPADAGLPDPSGLSITPSVNRTFTPAPLTDRNLSPTPETPSMARHSTPFPGAHRLTMTPSTHVHESDPSLYARFKKVEWYGRGEFSEVYKVYKSADEGMTSYFGSSQGSFEAQGLFPTVTPKADKVFIVKKTKNPYMSQKSRDTALREANIMHALRGNEHIVELYDYWEVKGHLYLQTEFCEEGSLSQFLERIGRKGRLDDFRIWKILLDLALGVQHIHSQNIIHLDLKPENVFIDFSGSLKIGDFGLASEWPVPHGVDGEGDRRYMGPEIINGKFDKPADIFALGMIMFEIASNYEVPDNGTQWQVLRSGDFSGLPSLTSASTQSLLHNTSDSILSSRNLDDAEDDARSWFTSPPDAIYSSWQGSATDGQQVCVQEEALDAPLFMVNPNDPGSLDKLVHWMMLPDYWSRPTVEQVVGAYGCQWVATRRRSGAIIFEGLRGPPSHVLKDHDQDRDTDMLDV